MVLLKATEIIEVYYFQGAFQELLTLELSYDERYCFWPAGQKGLRNEAMKESNVLDKS